MEGTCCIIVLQSMASIFIVPLKIFKVPSSRALLEFTYIWPIPLLFIISSAWTYEIQLYYI